MFIERYGIDTTYTDAEQMLRDVQPEIVAVATNTKHRADLTCLAVHFRPGAPGLRLGGEDGEIVWDKHWRLWKDIEVERVSGGRAEVPWPNPDFNVPYGAIYCFDDVMQCLAGKLDGPKNSGRRVGIALEVEVALLTVFSSGRNAYRPAPDRSQPGVKLRLVPVRKPFLTPIVTN